MTTRIIYTRDGLHQAQRIAAQAAAAHDHAQWALAITLFKAAVLVIQIPQEAAQ